MSTRITAGKKLAIRAGTKVQTATGTVRRERDTLVTVRRVEKTATGKNRVYWKSNGYIVSTTV